MLPAFVQLALRVGAALVGVSHPGSVVGGRAGFRILRGLLFVCLVLIRILLALDPVALCLGIGITAGMAFNPAEDRNLGMADASHLFESSPTRIGVRRNAYLRGYTYAFIELFAPHLTRKVVDAALAGHGSDPGL